MKRGSQRSHGEGQNGKLVKSAFTGCVRAHVRERERTMRSAPTSCHGHKFKFCPQKLFARASRGLKSRTSLRDVRSFSLRSRKNKTAKLVKRRTNRRPLRVAAALICTLIYSWWHFGGMSSLYVAVSALLTLCEEKTSAVTIRAHPSVEGSCRSVSAGFRDGFPWVVCRVTFHCSSRANSAVYLQCGYLFNAKWDFDFD